MCGRYTLTSRPQTIATFFGLDEVPELEPRYNVAPGQQVAILRPAGGGGALECTFAKWGLIPSWAKDPSIGYKTINARSEEAAQKPAYRSAFRQRRCLIPADGFYEWRKQGKVKQPFLFQTRTKEPFGMAGLWEEWESPEGEVIVSCTILTTGANSLVESVHPRMPVILRRDDYDTWLQPKKCSAEHLAEMLVPYPGEDMISQEVSTWVNNARNEGPGCWEKLETVL
jgi:putative SOS response-associated peptidase YedK